MRLIDIDELRHDFKVAEFCDKCVRANKWDCDKQMYSVRDICGLLDDSEIVDVPPVVHAHWIEYHTDIMCSHCHATYKDEIVDTYQDSVDNRRYVGLEYCPHCGSIMIGDDEDD